MNATRRRTTRTTRQADGPTRIAATASASVVRLTRVRTALQRIRPATTIGTRCADRLATAVLKELQRT